jgi:hypothetical protein
MEINSTPENNQIAHSYAIARGIDGILWIWEKIQNNLWKVYPYEKPKQFHFEDDLGNILDNSISIEIYNKSMQAGRYEK